MDVVAHLEAPHPPELVFALVRDLGGYPQWLDIVPRAEPEDGATAAWTVDLRARLGPFARAKRLRMVRTEDIPSAVAAFERAEDDGRAHSPWVLRAEVALADEGGGSRLTMRLHYGGSLWAPVLERLLGDTITRSRPKLLALLDAGSPPAGP